MLINYLVLLKKAVSISKYKETFQNLIKRKISGISDFIDIALLYYYLI